MASLMIKPGLISLSPPLNPKIRPRVTRATVSFPRATKHPPLRLRPNLSARVSAVSAPSPAELTPPAAASVISQRLQNVFAYIARAIGPIFVAAKNVSVPSARPLMVAAAAGMAKWLEVYSGVLMLRVLLSWFPNMPWDKQPLSAIRDLCDPYLNLFRNLTPPIFGSLDLSPLLAFSILGFLSSLLNTGA